MSSQKKKKQGKQVSMTPKEESKLMEHVPQEIKEGIDPEAKIKVVIHYEESDKFKSSLPDPKERDKFLTQIAGYLMNEVLVPLSMNMEIKHLTLSFDSNVSPLDVAPKAQIELHSHVTKKKEDEADSKEDNVVEPGA